MFMNIFIQSFFFISFLPILASECSIDIIESSYMADIFDHLHSNNTLVIFDIDDTLAQPATSVGGQQWYNHGVSLKIKNGISKEQAIQEEVTAFRCLQSHISLKPIESNTPEIIKRLQHSNIQAIALTSRSSVISDRTIEQLKHIDIGFAPRFIQADELWLEATFPYVYKKGVIFCGKNNKGEALLNFLKAVNYYPSKIIFVDDTLSHLHDVGIALTSRIPFLGIHYKAGLQNNRFNLQQAEQCWKDLMHHCE